MQPPAPTPASPPAATEQDLEAEFPAWHVWRTTDAGTWWAVRRGRTWAQPCSLAADTAAALRAQLQQTHSAAEAR